MNPGHVMIKLAECLMRSLLLGTILALSLVRHASAAPLEAAAESYFNKRTEQLNLAEMAMMAGSTKAGPSRVEL
jgi:uncharacterized membrane protein (DUF441 family)